MNRIRLPTTRKGVTHKVRVGACSMYLTANTKDGAIMEVFGKADEGHQAEIDGLCILASLALQHGCPAATIARHLRHRRYPPHGIAGQPCSLSDALGMLLDGTIKGEAV